MQALTYLLEKHYVKSNKSRNSTQALFSNHTGDIVTTLLEQLRAEKRNWKRLLTCQLPPGTSIHFCCLKKKRSPFCTSPNTFLKLEFWRLSITKTPTLMITSIFLLSILSTGSALSLSASFSACITFALVMLTSLCDQRRWFLSSLTSLLSWKWSTESSNH